jgi:hypothetical protein
LIAAARKHSFLHAIEAGVRFAAFICTVQSKGVIRRRVHGIAYLAA